MDTSRTGGPPGERKRADVELTLGLGKRQGGKTGERGPDQIQKASGSEDVCRNKAELMHASAFSPLPPHDSSETDRDFPEEHSQWEVCAKVTVFEQTG